MCLTMARPRPVPFFLRLDFGIDAVEALGEARHVLGLDAGAVVGDGHRAVDSRGRLATGASATSTLPPSPPYLMALSMRFSNTS